MTNNDKYDTAATLSGNYSIALAELFSNPDDLSTAIAATVSMFVKMHNVPPEQLLLDIVNGLNALAEGTFDFRDVVIHPGTDTVQ